MKVKELIEKLQELDQEAIVCIPGHDLLKFSEYYTVNYVVTDKVIQGDKSIGYNHANLFFQEDGSMITAVILS